MQSSRWRWRVVLCFALGLTSAPLLAAEPLADDVFARVDGEVITQQTFDTFLQVGKRQRFFHGDVPEDQARAFRKEVAQRLVDQVLLRSAASKRGIVADEQWVAERLAAIEARYQHRPHWAAQREDFIAELRPQVEEQSRQVQLEAQLRQVGEPERSVVEGYYRAHPEKFTTPQRLRVSVILLGVEPWAQSAQWQAAMEEGERLLKKLRQGGDFAALAKLHSSDESAPRGGDMGFVHQGMLADEAQQVIDGMEPGEVSEPLRLLKGVAIFRVEERQAPVLNAFERVARRAQELYIRETSDSNWQKFIEELRGSAVVQVKEPL